MAPTKTPKLGESSSSTSKIRKNRPNHRKNETSSTSARPGVQKLKSALRQTRRLLAKDNLAADVRVETARKLRSLEADLALAQLSKKERVMAVKYHKVKFFERQKIVRKLIQVKRKLSDVSGSSRMQLDAELLELRINLNYILHYPKTKKYISLFPPEARGAADHPLPKSDLEKTNSQREELRCLIRQQMADGELPSDPELHLDPQERKHTREPGKSHKTKATSSPGEPTKADAVDDFFGEDDDSGDDSEE